MGDMVFTKESVAHMRGFVDALGENVDGVFTWTEPDSASQKAVKVRPLPSVCADTDDL